MATEHHVTLLPTRLREFDERIEHAFAHEHLERRKSDTCPYAGDQYMRHPSPVDVLLNEEDEAFNAFRRIFKTAAVPDPSNGQDLIPRQVLEVKKVPLILGKLGQEYDMDELEHWIKGQDRHGLGFLDFDAYQRICVHFIKDPEALLRAKDKDFKFGHLITHDEEKKH